MVTKRDPEATREALLEAAESVFLEKGFGNTSLSEIGRRAGLTKSLIHHYFGSKEGLWREVKQRRFDWYAQQQMTMLSDETTPNAVLLYDSIRLYFHFLKENPEIVRILAWMYLERDQEECIHKEQALLEKGTAKIREGQEAGFLRSDIDPRFLLFTFIGLAQHWFQDKEHFIHDFGTEGLPEDLDEAYLEHMMKIFFEGILPRK